jgi:dihydrofolate reductase
VSIDGFGAGPRQALSDPMGVGGMALHEWVFPTRFFMQMHRDMGLGGNDGGGTTGVDNDFAVRGFDGIGAWILGRNMFGPSRGPWVNDGWKGWWGESPPYHVPVFVLTHHRRDPLPMKDGTTFHFVTGGIREAHKRAMDAAGGRDVRVGGGVNTVRQYLGERLIDEMHLAVGPALLGSGEHLLGGVDLVALGYEVAEHVQGPRVTHVVIRRKA